MRSDFAAFILTHGRPDKIVTLKSLKDSGYTGPVYLVCDNEDKSLPLYKEKYGDKVVVFDKKAVADMTDEGDNFDDRRTITHARNASYLIAKDLGYRFFIQLDDDYDWFGYRFNEKLEFKAKRILKLDIIFGLFVKFLEETPCKSVAMAQGGDFIGGANGGTAKNIKPKRKAMNTFFCDTEKPVKFVGRMNEDVDTYTSFGNRGDIFMTIPLVAINQMATQSNAGGITETYLEYGTYVKAFYTVMYCPSFVKISMMGNVNMRLHHKINWKKAVPQILNPSLKK